MKRYYSITILAIIVITLLQGYNISLQYKDYLHYKIEKINSVFKVAIDEEYAIRKAEGGRNNRSNHMPGALRVHQEAGDAILFNPMALHRGRYRSGILRRTLMLTYTKTSEPWFDYFSNQPWFSQPGFLLAIVAILVGLIYKLSLSDIFNELWLNIKKMKFSALTIGMVVALAYVMGDSGQTLALGLFIAGAGAVYPFLAPMLGYIGTYVTGSDTSANILFSNLQSTVAQQIGEGSALGVEGMRHLLVGTGAAGGVVGKMISPQSLTVAATAIGLMGSESVILRKVLKYSLFLLFLMCILAGLMSTPVLSWVLP